MKGLKGSVNEDEFAAGTGGGLAWPISVLLSLFQSSPSF